MRTVALGRSGLTTTSFGLGAGGPSRIGKSTNASRDDSIKVVREAVECGIRFFDTAEAYGTESIIGEALSHYADRDDLVVSTKLTPTGDHGVKRPEEIEASLDASLDRLGRECIDIYHVHGVGPELYTEVCDRIHPVLLRMREKGKIRSIGITEQFAGDSNHSMLSRAVKDDLWDVMMIGFNIFNPSARRLLAETMRKHIGVLDMFAVRRAFRSLEELDSYVDRLIEDSIIDGGLYRRHDPFHRAIEAGECRTVAEMAYRFCHHEPGIDVVLTGTGSIGHLRENRLVADLPPLTPETLSRLSEVFGAIDSVSGN